MGKNSFRKLGEKKKKRAGWNFGMEAGWREGSFREEDLLKIHEQRQRPTGEKIRKMTCLKDETLLNGGSFLSVSH